MSRYSAQFRNNVLRKVLPPELVANGPNQVWCWDITWLPTQVKGIFLFA
jgi:transposase InsO family protein